MTPFAWVCISLEYSYFWPISHLATLFQITGKDAPVMLAAGMATTYGNTFLLSTQNSVEKEKVGGRACECSEKRPNNIAM